MYAWRRWRDTAVYFSLCSFFSLVLTSSFRSGQPGIGEVETSWLLLGFPVALLIGLVIGSRSIGTEIGGGYGDFIVTRPRSRRYFIWTGWAVGVAEISVLLAIATLSNAGTLYYRDRFFLRQMPATVVDIPMFLTSVAVFTLVVYSATYLASVLTRRSSLAIGITFGLSQAYQMIVNRVGWAHSHLPDMLVVAYKPFRDEHARAAAMHALLIWTVCAFLFPFLAQLFFEGSEI